MDSGLKQLLWSKIRVRFCPEGKVLPFWLECIWALLFPMIAIGIYRNKWVGYNSMTDSFNVGLGKNFSIPYLLVYKLSKLSYNEKIILSKDPSGVLRIEIIESKDEHTNR